MVDVQAEPVGQVRFIDNLASVAYPWETPGFGEDRQTKFEGNSSRYLLARPRSIKIPRGTY